MSWNIYYTGLNMPELSNISHNDFNIRHTPTIEIDYLPPGEGKNVIEAINEFHYLVFLSQNGVAGFKNLLLQTGTAIPEILPDTWGVGQKTAAAASQVLNVPVSSPKQQNAIGLIKYFARQSRKPLLLITAEEPRPEFIDWLTVSDWDFRQVKVYRTDLKLNVTLGSLDHLSDNDVVIFASPSTVKGFIRCFPVDDLSSFRNRFVSFGPSTTNEILSKKGKIFWETNIPSTEYVIKKTMEKLTGLN